MDVVKKLISNNSGTVLEVMDIERFIIDSMNKMCIEVDMEEDTMEKVNAFCSGDLSLITYTCEYEDGTKDETTYDRFLLVDFALYNHNFANSYVRNKLASYVICLSSYPDLRGETINRNKSTISEISEAIMSICESEVTNNE